MVGFAMIPKNAPLLAKTPHSDRIMPKLPSGHADQLWPDVGLAQGQIGGLEVGHYNTGPVGVVGDWIGSD